MSARDAATELDRRIAAALKATAGSIGPLGGTVKRVNSNRLRSTPNSGHQPRLFNYLVGAGEQRRASRPSSATKAIQR